MAKLGALLVMLLGIVVLVAATTLALFWLGWIKRVGWHEVVAVSLLWSVVSSQSALILRSVLVPLLTLGTPPSPRQKDAACPVCGIAPPLAPGEDGFCMGCGTWLAWRTDGEGVQERWWLVAVPSYTQGQSQ